MLFQGTYTQDANASRCKGGVVDVIEKKGGCKHDDSLAFVVESIQMPIFANKSPNDGGFYTTFARDLVHLLASIC